MAKSSFCTHLIRNERPSRSTENKHYEAASMWCPLGTFSYFFKMQFSVSVVFSQIDKHKRVCNCQQGVSLRVYIVIHIALKCLLLFLPLLEGVWLTGGGGNSQQRRDLAHPVRGREWRASSASSASRNKDGNGETEPHRWPSLQHSAAIRIT